MGYERVEVTGKAVDKWWGYGWRYKVDVLVGLNEQEEALYESVELKPKKYTLRGAEAEIVSGAMGRLIPTDTLEIVTFDTEGNKDKIGRLVEKVAKNPKVRAQYAEDFGDRLMEKLDEAAGIVRRS